MIRELDPSKRFLKDIKRLDAKLQEAVEQALEDMLKDPIPNGRRMEKIGSIYTIHVTGNHSHKLSFSIDGEVARLRRFGTHREIDDAP